MEAVLKQESMTDIVRKYGVSTPVTGSDVIKLIRPIKHICCSNNLSNRRCSLFSLSTLKKFSRSQR